MRELTNGELVAVSGGHYNKGCQPRCKPKKNYCHRPQKKDYCHSKPRCEPKPCSSA